MALNVQLSLQTATESNELNITLSPPTMQDTNFNRPPPGKPGLSFYSFNESELLQVQEE